MAREEDETYRGEVSLFSSVRVKCDAFGGEWWLRRYATEQCKSALKFLGSLLCAVTGKRRTECSKVFNANCERCAGEFRRRNRG